MKRNNQVCLNVHSAYSLLESTLRIKQIIQLAIKYNYQSIALSDYHSLSGAVEFYDECLKYQLKPIIGMEIKLLVNDSFVEVIAYAKNKAGYQALNAALVHITKQGHLILDQLDTTNLIVILSSNYDYDSYLRKQEVKALNEIINKLNQACITFYLGLCNNRNALYQKNNELLISLATKNNIQLVPVEKVYFDSLDNLDAYKAICAINQTKLVNDPALEYQGQAYFIGNEVLANYYDSTYINNLQAISDLVEFDLNTLKTTLPSYEEISNKPSQQYLQDLALFGLKKRLNNQVNETYLNRLNYELSIINSKGFSDYFLIVFDFIRYAKKHGIMVGPGRGSAAGSLVAYAIGIVEVDPIKYDLIFERFLNPERLSMPDIDIDFADNRRDEVVHYLNERYGVERVANIITFNTLAAKQVMRDVAKAYGASNFEVDQLAKAIPNILKITLQQAYQESRRFALLIESKEKYQAIFRVAQVLEGLPRHHSVHAAGVVISKNALSETIPVLAESNNQLLTGYTMEYLERFGLIKMDLLALRNLTIINNVQNLIKLSEPNFDIKHINLDDKASIDLIAQSKTLGIFQLESVGIRALMEKMKPNSFEEVCALIALYRPGPMQFIDKYLANRADKQNITYLHEDLNPIVSNTYGIVIYQEQVIAIAIKFANFSAGKAELLRKAISKKDGDKLASLQLDFLKGCIKQGYSEDLAKELFTWMAAFANYGFNRAHSVAYGMIALQMAYLKAHYSKYFYLELLNGIIGSNKMNDYLLEVKSLNYVVNSVDLRYSRAGFNIVNNEFYYPLSGIKGLRSTIIEQILKLQSYGLSEDYFELIAQLNQVKVTKGALESLIKAGALDYLGLNRMLLLENLDQALRYAQIIQIEEQDQTYLNFDLVSKPILIDVKDNYRLKLEYEFEVLGLYLSEHPINRLRKAILKEDLNLKQLMLSKQKYVYAVASIKRVKQHKTKKGTLMAFLELEDDSRLVDAVVFSNVYDKYKDLLVRGNYLYVQATNEDGEQLIINNLKKINLY